MDLDGGYGPGYEYGGTVNLWNGSNGETPFVFAWGSDVANPNPELGLDLRLLRDGGNQLRGFEVLMPDDGRVEYAYRNSSFSASRFFLSAVRDAQGRALTLGYDHAGDYGLETAKVRLRYVTNAVGQVVTLNYDGNGLVTTVTTPGSLSATLSYTNSNGKILVESIKDVVGIESRFYYDDLGWVKHLITPYGTTSFEYFDAGIDHQLLCDSVADRWVVIEEPDSARQIYARVDNFDPIGYSPCADIDLPTTFPASLIPNGTPLDTLDTADRNQRGTFYWDRHQSSLVPNTDPEDFDAEDFLRARWRRWLADDYDGLRYPDLVVLSTEQQPTPDGTTEGAVTWYDYAGKPDPDLAGPSVQPDVEARVVESNTGPADVYSLCARNDLGSVTNTVLVVAGTTTTYLTNRVELESNGIDKKWAVLPDGSVEGYHYDTTSHLPLRYTNAVGEVTWFTYTGGYQLQNLTNANGLVTAHSYDSLGNLTNVVDAAGGATLRTRSFTWSNGQMQTQTDERGLVTTFAFDGLGRLLRATYPDGTGETNLYHLFSGESYTDSTGGTNILERTASINRLGHTNRFRWNALRLLAFSVDARGVTNYNVYDPPGTLTESIRGYALSLAETNRFLYDDAARLVISVMPDGSAFTNRYDQWGRQTNITDAFGSVTNYYDTVGRLVAVTNGFGRVFSTLYDSRGRVISSTDANGVTTTNRYDALGRVLWTQLIGSSAADTFGYTYGYASATAYTNAIGNIQTWVFDPLQRKTNEVAVGKMTNSYAYNTASDLTDLYNGNGNRTQWRYDTYGQIVHKVYANNQTNLTYTYDALGRMTNRWSQTKGNTKYSYDQSGNQTNINYNVSPDIKFQFDALNRVTNMVDAAGTTKYTYANGLLATEDGPWTTDVLTWSYNNARQRSQLVISQPTGNAWTNTYAYDSARRLSSVVSPAGTFSYQFNGAGTLMTRLDQPSGFWITNTFDSRARLIDTTLYDNTSTILNRHGYAYNDAHQRTTVTRTNYASTTYNRKVDYTYDNVAEIRTARAYDGNGAAVAAENFDYGYDAGWNILKRTNNAAVTSYTVNNLNQITADGGASWSHDSNGSLTYHPTGGTGDLTYTYDDENQLLSVVSSSAYKHEFTYDGRGRVRVRKDYSWYSPGSTWLLSTEIRYLYDGMVIVQERNSSGHPTVTYTRGRDLSGSLDGAGGVGGLLSRGAHSGSSPYQLSSSANYHADGNGNVTMLVGSGSPSIKAYYKFDPFGRTLASGGSLATANAMRFSGKSAIGTSGLYYYGYRFYDSNTQRWLNRDPSGELGGEHLYALVRNQPIGFFDTAGLARHPSYPRGGPGDHFVASKVALNVGLLDGPGTRYFGSLTYPVLKDRHFYDSFHRLRDGIVEAELRDFCRKYGGVNAVSKSEKLAKLFVEQIAHNGIVGRYAAHVSDGAKATGIVAAYAHASSWKKRAGAAGALLALGMSAVYASDGVTDGDADSSMSGNMGSLLYEIAGGDLADRLVANLIDYGAAAQTGDDAQITLSAVEAAITLHEISGDYFTTLWALDMMLP